MENAGTDCQVDVQLLGSLGESAYVTAWPAGAPNALERGYADECWPGVPDVGDLRALRVRLIQQPTGLVGGAGSRRRSSEWLRNCAWFPTYFTVGRWVSRLDGADERGHWVVPCYRWFGGEYDDRVCERTLPAYRLAEVCHYEAIVHTGDVAHAGTNADVYLSYQDLRGLNVSFLLDSPADNFERGHSDVFVSRLPRMQNPGVITVRHNNRGPGPGWFLADVSISEWNYDPSTLAPAVRNREREGRPRWFYPCNQWLAIDEGDHQIQRTLRAR